ncbi:hypothetical protein [Nostocoides sp. HKS02]|uniref:hypothetical protein n=1 Tax=Nostocoides sp. HKS02 TaxID=1813880 RepID=UPI0012B4A5FB|nr:hypothetical protein [Tetrasphaera sp. HKS02]QGN57510.1 hypothetical protein GKE56_06090 [Tetrasphaera sp. HKS02]
MLFPATAIALPPTVTGALAGPVTWLPPPAEPEPEVVDPDELAGAAAADEPEEPAEEPVLDESPSTATELPVTVDGGAVGEVTWLPPPAEPEPEVVDPDELAGAAGEEPEGADPAEGPLLDESPSTATELPVTVDGGAVGEVTWLPPPAEPEPEVVDPGELGGAVAAEEPEGADPVDEPVLDELPSTATELPVTVDGGAVGEVTWLPPPAEPEPEVVDPGELAGAAAADEPEEPAEEPLLDALPSTATELPPAVTGAAGAVATWLPPSALCVPVVPSSADACPAKNRIPPPTMRATSRPLRMYACMVVPFL